MLHSFIFIIKKTLAHVIVMQLQSIISGSRNQKLWLHDPKADSIALSIDILRFFHKQNEARVLQPSIRTEKYLVLREDVSYGERDAPAIPGGK